MNKNVLITGSSGLIGRALCARLLNDNHAVFGLDTRPSIIEHENYTHAHSLNIFNSIFFDEIYHLSGDPCPSIYLKNPYGIMVSAANNLQQVFEIAKVMKSKMFIASSSEIYGDTDNEMVEENTGVINPLDPRSCYKETKRFMEVMALSFQRQYNIDVKIGRIFNTYGSSNEADTRIISSFIYNILNKKQIIVYGDGEQKRSYCYVDDTVEGIIVLMNSKYNTPTNIGNPNETYSVNEVITILNAIFNKKISVKHKNITEMIGPKYRLPNIDKMKKLKWEPQISLHQGILNMQQFGFFK